MIGLIGLSYKKAPIDIRERFSFTNEEIQEYRQALTQKAEIKSAIVMSTCNRTEIYFHADDTDSENSFEFVLDTLIAYKNADKDSKSYFYKKANKKAVNHLFSVASGLDSLILGEDQIIGQIKNAYLSQKEQLVPGKILMRLFEKSLEAGKKVRAQTTINTGAASVSAASVVTALQHFPNIAEKNVLMIGAGETGALTIQSLAKHGFNKLYIANRTRSKAENLARQYKGEAIDLDKFYSILDISDIVIVATSAQHPVITNNMIKKLNLVGEHAQKLLIDLSVPRNICNTVADIEGITLYTVDDMEKIMQKTSEIRNGAVIEANEIITDLCDEFESWNNEQKLTPTIIKIKENLTKMGQLQTSEFRGNIRSNADMPHFSNYLTKKYIGLFIKNLKKATDNGKRDQYLEFANELFEMKA